MSEYDLNKMLKVLKVLKENKAIITICSYCHKIEGNKGRWNTLEQDAFNLSEFHFSHGICPKCLTQVRIESRLSLKDE